MSTSPFRISRVQKLIRGEVNFISWYLSVMVRKIFLILKKVNFKNKYCNVVLILSTNSLYPRTDILGLSMLYKYGKYLELIYLSYHNVWERILQKQLFLHWVFSLITNMNLSLLVYGKLYCASELIRKQHLSILPGKRGRVKKVFEYNNLKMVHDFDKHVSVVLK